MQQIVIGDVRIDCVEEICAPMFPPQMFLPALPEGAIAEHASWLAPDFFEPNYQLLVLAMQSWVVRTAKHTILVDTCIGNGKHRPSVPPFDNLSSPYVERLAEVGLAPADIDFVMCTHLHVDHVGWNTRLENGRWVPTFPNARYLFGRQELAAVERRHAQAADADDVDVLAYKDSILPVIDAGRMELVDDGFCVEAGMTIEAAPGHTSGHMLLRVASNAATGLLSGDVVNHPLQIVYPHVSTAFCEDATVAEATRRRVLGECADRGHLLLPAHFGGSRHGRVSRNGDAFRYHPAERR